MAIDGINLIANISGGLGSLTLSVNVDYTTNEVSGTTIGFSPTLGSVTITQFGPLTLTDGVYSFTGSGIIDQGGQAAGQPVQLVVSFTGETPGTVEGSVTVGQDAPIVFASPVTYTVVCYARGTTIRTERGDVAVEELKIGDLAVTAAGALRPIVWLGHRTMSCRNYFKPKLAYPVRVKAGAFGDGLPERDLYVSYGHAVFFDGALIPVSALLNGSTVASVEMDEVQYWHVELESHDLLIANGLPAESYIDAENRQFFFKEAGHAAAPCKEKYPRVFKGPAVEAARALLTARLLRAARSSEFALAHGQKAAA
jgi:hypothetical protein